MAFISREGTKRGHFVIAAQLQHARCGWCMCNLYKNERREVGGRVWGEWGMGCGVRGRRQMDSFTTCENAG